MAKYVGLTKDEYLKEVKSFISLVELYLNRGDLDKAEEYLRAALGALASARKAK